MELIRRFWDDDSGPELVEWAVVTLVLLAATVTVLVLMRGLLVDILKSMFYKLQEDPNDAWIPSGGTGGPTAPPPVPGPTPTT